MGENYDWLINLRFGNCKEIPKLNGHGKVNYMSTKDEKKVLYFYYLLGY